MEGTCAPQHEPLLSDEEIASWFDNKEAVWRQWANEFAHHDSTRLTTGLHPAQLLQLCEGVRGFVQLTDDGKLPQYLLTGGTKATRILLHSIGDQLYLKRGLHHPILGLRCHFAWRPRESGNDSCCQIVATTRPLGPVSLQRHIPDIPRHHDARKPALYPLSRHLNNAATWRDHPITGTAHKTRLCELIPDAFPRYGPP